MIVFSIFRNLDMYMKYKFLWYLLVVNTCCEFVFGSHFYRKTNISDDNGYPKTKSYNYFLESKRLEMKEKVKEMFYFGYDNYMKYAFPLDELNPIYCTGRGPDKANP